MSVADAILLSFYVLLPGWASLAIAAVLLVIAAWPPKKNRRVR